MKIKQIYPIKKTVRITNRHDKLIKKGAKKYNGESAFIRALVDNFAYAQSK